MLQEMHCYFLVNEYVAATQRIKKHLLLYLSRLVHDQLAFRQRNRRIGLGLDLVRKIGLECF